MGRIRTIKPQFFTHEDLYDLEVETGLPVRLAFAGLWTCCDREGRFKWRPRELKLSVLPYDNIDFSRVLDALASRGFIVRYECVTGVYGHVPSWNQHQVINNRESPSEIPSPNKYEQNQDLDASGTREARVDDETGTPLVHAQGEGKGREGKGNTRRDAVSADMVAMAVRTELSLGGNQILMTLEDVCKAELSKGTDAEHLRDSLVKAYRDYEIAKPKLEYSKGATKFFAEGDWRNPSGWPWKKGAVQEVSRRYIA